MTRWRRQDWALVGGVAILGTAIVATPWLLYSGRLRYENGRCYVRSTDGGQDYEVQTGSCAATGMDETPARWYQQLRGTHTRDGGMPQ